MSHTRRQRATSRTAIARNVRIMSVGCRPCPRVDLDAPPAADPALGHGRRLGARDVGAEAGVHAAADRDMLVGRAVGDESLGRREGARVTVGDEDRALQHVAGRDRPSREARSPTARRGPSPAPG